MSKNKKNTLNIIFVIACFLFTIYYVFKGQDLVQILKYMKDANSIYWILGILLVIVYILSESVIIHYLLRKLGFKTQFKKCAIYSFVGFFFCCITPSATGGQPAQAVIMKKDGVPLHSSSLILIGITIAYKIVLLLYAFLIFIFKPPLIMQHLEPIFLWIYIGLAINVLMVAVMLVLIFKPNIAKTIVNGIFKGVYKITKSEKSYAYKGKIESSMNKYIIQSDYITGHKLTMFKVFIISLFQRTVLFSITYFVCLSFNSNSLGFINTTTIQGIISVAVDMLPVPGGMGAAEHLFYKAFKPVFGDDLTVPIMIVSRGLSYYTQLIISAIITLVAYIKYYNFTLWRKNS